MASAGRISRSKQLAIEGAERLLAKLDPHDMLDPPLVSFVRGMNEEVRAALSRFAPRFTGELAGSFQTEFHPHRGFRNAFGEVSSDVAYSGFADTGTPPHFPPVGALREWAEAKGLNAFLVARAMSRKSDTGTRSKRFRRKALTHVRRVLRIAVDRVGADIEKRWVR